MTDNKQPKTVMLKVRCSTDLATRLERVAAGSVTRNLSDHIRYALERYVDEAGTPAPVTVPEPQG